MNRERSLCNCSGGDRLGPGGGHERKRDAAKRRVKRVGHEVKAAGSQVKAKLRVSRSFTEYRAIAGDSFIDPRRLTKVGIALVVGAALCKGAAWQAVPPPPRWS